MLFRQVLGVYLKEKSLSLVALKKTISGVRVSSFSEYPLEKGNYLKTHTELAESLIHDFIRENRLNCDRIYICIPAELTIRKKIVLPYAVKENLDQTISYELEKYIPIQPDAVYFDYRVTRESKSENVIEIALTVVKKETVSSLTGLKGFLADRISGIETTSSAMVNFCAFTRKGFQEEKKLAMIVCETDRVELLVFEKGLLQRTRIWRVGDDGYRLETVAEETIREVNGGLENGPERVVWVDSDPQNTRYLFSRFSSHESGLPSSSLHTLKISGEEHVGANCFFAFATALKGLLPVKAQVNLLPTDLRKTPGRAMFYVAIILTALLIVSAVAWGGGLYWKKHKRLDVLEEKTDRMTAQMKQMDKLREDIGRLENRLNYLTTLGYGREDILDVLLELSLRLPESAWVRRLNFDREGLKLEGYADSAHELIPILENSAKFRDVGFLSRIIKSGNDKDRYVIGLKLEQ